MKKRVYVFDFDVNLLHLDNFNIHVKENDEIIKIKSEDWATFKQNNTYQIIDNSFIEFEDDDKLIKEGLLSFVTAKFGPSWHTFIDAINDKHDIAIITARGNTVHAFHTLFSEIVKKLGYQYDSSKVTIYPVSHPFFIMNNSLKIEELKFYYFSQYLERFNPNDELQIGFSDDDVSNVNHLYDKIQNNISHMKPNWSFYIFNTSNNSVVRHKL